MSGFIQFELDFFFILLLSPSLVQNQNSDRKKKKKAGGRGGEVSVQGEKTGTENQARKIYVFHSKFLL